MNDITPIAHPALTPAEPRPEGRQRKPDWIRVKAPMGAVYNETKGLMRRLGLNTGV